MKIAKATLVALLLLCIIPATQADDGVLADVVVDFELIDADGDLVRFDTYRGRNVLLAFGFTHCHHICPTIAANMARALRATDKQAVGIFVSVDTERDTPAITHAYSQKFGGGMVGLGGSYAQVAAAAKNFNVTFVVTKSEDNYTVQHTPNIFLIGPDGRLIEVFAMNSSPTIISEAMR